MKIIRESALGNVQVFSFILFTATILCTVFSNLFLNIDYCATERIFESKDSKHSSFMHHIHLFISFGCVLLIGLQLIFWNPLKYNSNRLGNRFRFNDRSVFLILYTFLWYGSTYCLCYLLKRILDDKTCNRTHNSVSGHFLFHSFYLIAVPYWFLTIGRLHYKQIKQLSNSISSRSNNSNKVESPISSPNIGNGKKPTTNRNKNNKKSPSSSPKIQHQKQTKENIPLMEPRHELLLIKKLLTENSSTVLIIISYGIYCYSSWINLEKTWVDGFHSIRQILYGLILSFLSLYVLLFATSKCNNLDKRSSCFKLVLYLTGYWIVSILLLNNFSVRIPFGMVEKVLFFVCHLFLVYFSFFRSQNQTETTTKTKKE